MDAATRTRSYAWGDSAEILAAAPDMSGLELLTAIAERRLPAAGIGATLGMEPVSAAKGEAAFALEPAEFHYNPLGTVHGGVLATMLDSAVACAVHTTLDKGYAYTTLTLEVKYVRAASAASGRLTATGKVVTRGRQIATAEGAVTDARGRVFATATTTCLIFPLPTAKAAA